MKNKLLHRLVILFLLIIPISLICFSQETKEFFSSNDVQVTWLGVDFSEVRLLGDMSTTPADMKDKYFYTINDVIVRETEKYDFAKAFRKSQVASNLQAVTKSNSLIDSEKLITYKTEDMKRLTPQMIENIVKNYDLGNLKGYGIIFIVEGLDKTAPAAYMYVTIINIDTKKVIMSKRVAGKAKGFGIRNYWAGAVYDVIKDIKYTYYKKWASE